MRYFHDHYQHHVKDPISLSEVSHLCINFLLTWSCTCPHAFHIVLGALHFCRIAHATVPLSLPNASHRSHIGLILVSLSSHGVTHGEVYLYLEPAQESPGLFKAINTYCVPLAVRNCFWLYRCSFSWQRPSGPSSAFANSLGLTSL
jgi:hypothetical protein